jgi:hypothetical protein
MVDTEENEENQRTMIVEGIMRKVSVLIFLIRREFHRGTGTFSNHNKKAILRYLNTMSSQIKDAY